ncbi:MAG: tripartite tricarboxylate transporter TctB family protein [Desulfobacteraceae bacterium]|nr:MAG: tripartite tricarboxylate transporter TctB family protein [Desulfobacteraceae bacterium]
MGEGSRPSRKTKISIGIDTIGGLFLLLLGLYVTWERRVLPLGTAQTPGPGYFPLILAILLIIFGAILVLRGRHSRPFTAIPWAEASHAIPVIGCCVFVALFMERIGYRISLFVVLGFLLGVVERVNIWAALILTLLLSMGSFWLFDTLLRVPLPRGGWGF